MKAKKEQMNNGLFLDYQDLMRFSYVHFKVFASLFLFYLFVAVFASGALIVIMKYIWYFICFCIGIVVGAVILNKQNELFYTLKDYSKEIICWLWGTLNMLVNSRHYD